MNKALLCLSVCISNLVFALAASAQNVPVFSATYANAAIVDKNANQKQYAPNLDLSSGVQPTGPAEVTNATQLYVKFLSDSLGNTNLSDATAATGFNLAGSGISSIPNIIDPPANPNPANLYYSCLGTLLTNDAWLSINYIPGTNANTVTNVLQLVAFNGNNNHSTNWALTNLTLTVRAKQLLAPYLEVRFYNSSTNADDAVFILPTCKGLEGSGFWWTNAGVTNTWTNWMMQTTNMTVALADIGISGTNLQGKQFFSIYTTNFPNAAWFVSYQGGHLKAPTNALGQWDGTTTYGAGPNKAQPTVANTNGLWFGAEWNAFELTLDGNVEDVGDTTYINQFSIPMVMRVFTNSYADAQAQIYTNLDSENYFQIGGWTNFNHALLSNVVNRMMSQFSNGVVRSTGGVPVMVAGPSSASSGLLMPPWGSTNVWPSFADYFSAVRAVQTNHQAEIKDYIGHSDASGAFTYYFYYDFDLTVTNSNSLRLAGSMAVSNAPGSSGPFSTNVTNLVIQVGGDSGLHDNWASWCVYTAPTPANFTVATYLHDLSTGAPTDLYTNLMTYSAYAENGLGGTPVAIAGSNFLGAVQVAFCGAGNTLIPSQYYTVESDTNLTVYVPYGAQSGPIVVTTPNGSGQSADNFIINGTSVQHGPGVSPTAGAPFISGVTPTNGVAASAVCTISGDWAGIAGGSDTGPDDGSLVELFNSAFGTAVMGRILGDMAAGFALGFINSDSINGAYAVDGTNQPYGESPSGSWWGGNEYPAGNTNLWAYSLVNSNYSPWGNVISMATAATYGHPIYDRMQAYSGSDVKAVIQPLVALNGTPNIWMAEIEFFDGMASVHSGGTSSNYTLIYQKKAGGTVSGVLTQTVDAGQSGSSVEALLADTSVVFHAWSDGMTDNPRTDANVTADINVYTIFLSRGGANLEWYLQHGFAPSGGEEWSDLDSKVVPGKGTTLLEEYIADTDPNDPGSRFRMLDTTTYATSTVVSFEPAVTDRVYTIEWASDLVVSNWLEATGTMRYIGNNQGEYLVSTNADETTVYRINVNLP